MTARKWRLALAAILFAAWIGWLTYLAFANRNPIVLSRPQLLASNVHIIAKVNGTGKPNANVVVEEVVWATDSKALKQGESIDVGNLNLVGAAQGWDGQGSYLIPLMRSKDGKYSVAATPSSPGYPPALKGNPPVKFTDADRLAIYPATDETRSRLKQIYDEWGR